VVAVKAGKNEGAKAAVVLYEIFSKKELKMERSDLILESTNSLPDFLK